VSHWRLTLLLLALPGGVPGAPLRDPLSALDTCIEQLDSGLDVGYARIAARCPDLAPSLLASPWAPWLPADWNRPKNQLSARGLADLRDALAREAAAPATGGRELHIERVPAILKQLGREETGPESWWTRFKRWLRELLTPQPSTPSNWWRRLFGQLSLEDGALRALVWGSLALVSALAVGVIVNELRVAGLLRPRRTGTPVRPGARAPGPGLTLDELEGASAAQQPALLLEFIAARLAEQDRLPPSRALTVRELTRRARLGEESDRASLAQLAAVCERVRFSDREVTAATVAEAMARGRELLRVLLTSAAPSGAT
jgi:hypothetical protein